MQKHTRDRLKKSRMFFPLNSTGNTRYRQEVLRVLVEAGIDVNRNTAIWKIAFKTKGAQ